MRKTATLDEQGVREGYLLLADISGYTAFLTGTELEHSHEIIRELATLIRERLAPPMRFVKREGDAVFCYAEAGTFREGERLVEIIEACYFEFSNRLLDMTRATTCRCAACGTIGSLGLKFVAHYGTYVVERDAGGEDLAGPDVILAHRLLKNTISEGGGPQAYAFFTEACLQRLPPSFAMPTHVESYESFGETRGGVHDLGPVLSAMREERRLYISAADADFEATFDVPIPPALAWQYVVDPLERQRWACAQYDKNPDRDEPNAQGRLGVGAKSHCGHGPGPIMSFREFIDWRPFAYFTARVRAAAAAGGFVMARPVIETIEFTPLGERGTRIAIRYREVNRKGILRLVSRATHPFFKAFWRRRGAELARIVKQDASRPGFDVEQTEAADA
ncbi:MAG TPA: DUF2652 domain-containing protein [Dehalococcoidia bacterium]|jgi:hypothetical protein|nr:DUF2652 domain-containing protein [Dehalococcoidia bacterium]